jgi:serralysin
VWWRDVSAINLGGQQITDALYYSAGRLVAGYFTVSIPNAQSTWPGYGVGDEPTAPNVFTPLTNVQAANFLLAIAEWDKIIAPNFLTTNDNTAPGAIRVGFSSSSELDDNTSAYAYTNDQLKYTSDNRTYDIWLNDDYISNTYDPTTSGFSTFLHELGHVLGLDHPFPGPNGSANPLPVQYDTRYYTVMAYDYPSASVLTTWFAGADGKPTNFTRFVAPTTPMVLDIYVAQNIYGADPTTAVGDTVYGFDQSAPTMKTIYDSGGVDTIDLGDHSRASLIDLNPGHYSSIDIYPVAQQIAAAEALFPAYVWGVAQFPDAFTWEDNLGIAYSTTIENVRAGSNNDTIQGNDAANNISGGGGNDSVSSGLGADTIDGGSGDNYLRGDDGNDSISGGTGFDDINGNKGDDTGSGGDGADWVVGGKDNDLLFGEAGNDLVYGNLGNDTCEGGDGDDIVRGGQGDDIVRGGNGGDYVSGDKGDDTVTGGAGADLFHTFGDAGIDRVTDFSAAEGDRVQLDPGTQYTLSQSGADTVISMTGGGQMILVGVQLSALPADWIFGA